jgi:hypothetical protein
VLYAGSNADRALIRQHEFWHAKDTSRDHAAGTRFQVGGGVVGRGCVEGGPMGTAREEDG